MSHHFLTKIEINFETAHKTGLYDSYDWHQKVWEAFPNRDGEARDFLTRLDEVDAGFRLLLLSPIPPVRPSWCPESAWQSKEFQESFFNHRYYQFSLLANPTKKVKSSPSGVLLKNSRRVSLHKREDLLMWVLRKAEQNGFRIDPEQIQMVPRPRQSFVKKGVLGCHSATEFVGRLEAVDFEKFKKAATDGIGSAKAFGFGMLCLSPLRFDSGEHR
jgi:CRISPR system Cascade subunit CasE